MGLTAALGVPGTSSRPRVDRKLAVLIGSRCRACGMPSWPSRAICHACGSSDVAFDEPVGDRGTLLTHTTVWVPRPGLESPYTLGQVELDTGVEVFAHVRGLARDARVPLAVALAIAPAADAVPSFWFEPVAGKLA